MSLTIRQLRYFIATAEAGKMSAAAAQCGVSQSAITVAMRDLEYQLGSDLFLRHQSGVTLTTDGHQFLRKAREVMVAMTEATRGLGGQRSESLGSLTIGVTYTVVGYYLGPHLLRFRRRFPALSLKVVQLERPQLEAALVSEEIDVAIMLVSNLSARSKISVQSLQSSPRRLWLPPNHPLSRQKSVTLHDAAREPYIMLTVDEAEDTTLRYWKQAGVEPNVILSTSSIEAVRSFVAGGLGITILSDMVYRPWSLESERLELRDIDGFVPHMEVGLAWKKQRQWTAEVNELAHQLQATTVRIGPVS